MKRFSFILHPQAVQDYAQRFPLVGYFPPFFLERIARYFPPFKLSEIKGVYSSFAQAEGEFICCPLTPWQLQHLPTQVVLAKIVSAVKLAERNGAKIVGLGELSALVGDGGEKLAQEVGIPITTGNSYLVYTVLEGIRKAAQLMQLALPWANVLILGASGSIGRVCARLMAKESKYITLAAYHKNRLEKLATQILYETGVAVKITDNLKTALRDADIVIAVTSEMDNPIIPEDLKPGAVLWGIGNTGVRQVTSRVVEKRKDVLVIEGGIIEVPGNPDFPDHFGFPVGKCSASMAEVMILALEKRFESFSLGQELTIEQVMEIGRLAEKHSFKLAGLYNSTQRITLQKIKEIKKTPA